MAYFIKKNNKDGKTHMFHDAVCFCDGKQHANYSLVSNGLSLKKTTCRECKAKAPDYVKMELGKIISKVGNS